VAGLTKTFRQDFKAHLDDLEEIRDFIGTSAQALGLAPMGIEEMQLCVDEAATNIAQYGYDGREGSLSIEISRQNDQLVVRILDDAVPFDPNSVAQPDLNIPLHDRPIGGMGVHLIRTLTDGWSHSFRPGGGNELVLRKRIQA
jgi:serine/threonine-protein kinase RsbW